MKIMIIGQGGHSKVVRDVILSNRKNQIIGFLDDQYKKLVMTEKGFCGPISAAGKMVNWFGDVRFIIAIGNNQIRKTIVRRLDLLDAQYATLIHPSAVVSPSAVIGNGCVITAHAVINADSRIGRHSIINTGAVIEHDSELGDFVHVSPNATLTGAVKIKEGTHVGAGATAIPGVKIGEWSTIGAGATVIDDLPSYCTAVGVPACVKTVKGRGGGETVYLN